MFGLKKTEKKPIFEYDLEKDMKDDKKQKALLQNAEKKLLAIKTELRQGTEQDAFEGLGCLLHGYAALLIIISNTTTSK